MTFETQEESLESGVPVTLYLFEYGNLSYEYTDHDEPITTGGKTYAPAPIGRSPIEQGRAGFDKAELEVDLSPTLSVVTFFRETPPAGQVSMRIFQGHADGSEFPAVWTGTVSAFQDQRPFPKIIGEPVYVAMKRNGLRRTWQPTCGYALYGAGCGVDKTTVRQQAEILVLGENYFEVPVNWEGPLGTSRYRGGFVSWNNSVTGTVDTRGIVRIQSGDNRLIINGEVYGVEVGDTLSIFPGCNKTLSTCKNVFGNLRNFGGFPWIPVENPFGRRHSY